MDVSKNRGTPKWMVSNGKPYWNWWFGGTTIFGNIHMDTPESPQFEPDNPRKNLFRKKKNLAGFVCFFYMVIMKGSWHLILQEWSSHLFGLALSGWWIEPWLSGFKPPRSHQWSIPLDPQTQNHEKNDGFNPPTKGLLSSIKLKVVSSHGSCIYFGMFPLSSSQ